MASKKKGEPEDEAPGATEEAAEIPAATKAPTYRAPRFQTYEDEAGAFRWRLVGANGEKVAASEAYPTRANARRALRDVIRIVKEIVALEGG